VLHSTSFLHISPHCHSVSYAEDVLKKAMAYILFDVHDVKRVPDEEVLQMDSI
jgi:hypothetical protein